MNCHNLLRKWVHGCIPKHWNLMVWRTVYSELHICSSLGHCHYNQHSRIPNTGRYNMFHLVAKDVPSHCTRLYPSNTLAWFEIWIFLEGIFQQAIHEPIRTNPTMLPSNLVIFLGNHHPLILWRRKYILLIVICHLSFFKSKRLFSFQKGHGMVGNQMLWYRWLSLVQETCVGLLFWYFSNYSRCMPTNRWQCYLHLLRVFLA